MPDREKVIRAIDGCINIGDYCNDCDYDGCVFHHGSCEKDLLANALELLKEQGAVEPYQHDAVWLCGNCEKEVVGWDDDIDGKEYRYPFCRQCGKAVKWNEQP